MRIENFLSSDAFTMVNKKLAKLIGIGKAIYLQELVAQRKRFKQDKFYFTQNDMEDELGISYKTQQRYANELQQLGLISVEKDGLPYRNWYTINDDLIYQLLIGETSIDKLSNQEKTECLNPSYIINKNNSKNISSKEEISEADNLSETDAFLSMLPNTTEKKEKNSAKKERKDITELIITLKATCTVEGVIYDNEDERMYAKHILDAEKFGEVAEGLGMTRPQFAVAVLIESIKNNFWKGYCTGPKKIYNSYVEIVNRFIANRNKQSNAVLDDL